MSKSIAFFDFDGTITRKDTLLEFIRFSRGEINYFIGLLICSPFIFAYKIKLISNQYAKEKVLTYFFRDIPLLKFNNYCQEFIKQKMPGLIRKEALVEIEKLKKEGFRIIIVSASPENWIGPWADSYKTEHLCTKLEIIDSKVTGKIDGRNCFGIEKVNRIKSAFDLREFSLIYAYGDSSGDFEMFKIAHQYYFRPFR